MNTTIYDAPRARRPGRGRWVFAAALLLTGCLAAAAGVAWWLRPAAPEPPVVDLSGADPAVAETVADGRQAVVRAPGSAAAWGKLGMVLLAHDFRPEAGVCFARAEALDPREFRWAYFQGYILSLDDPNAAAAKWRRAVELCGGRPAAPRLRLGMALLEQGRIDEAEDQFRRALGVEPDDPQAHLGLGRAEFTRGELQESLLHLGRATDAPSARKGAHALLAEVRQRLGDADGAARELRLVADLPDDAPWPDPVLEEVGRLQRGKQARLKRADELLAAGNVPEAVEWLRDLARDYPDTDWAWLRLGRALLQAGDSEGAERSLRTALRLTPDLVDGHFYLGVVLFGRGDFHVAAASFRRATELKPNYAVAHFDLGQCLVRDGDRDGATAEFRAAVENKPHFAEAHAALAVALAGEGRNAEALEHVRDALRLDPANAEASRLLAELDKNPK